MSVKSSPDYYLDEQQVFVVENYNRQKPFASFLPAVAGLYGKPMWVYYVNRGQAIATIGINNKNYAVMEFQPANKAYRQTPTEGFRTFLKIKDPATNTIRNYEPFQDWPGCNGNTKIRQKMYITSYDLVLEETNLELGIKVKVMYCTLPGEKLSSLIRRVTVANISAQPLEIEVLDGLPILIPYYLINQDLKNESNLRQAWMGVENYATLPFYKLKVLPYDTPETLFVEGGNFYLHFSFAADRKIDISPVIIDPGVVFGHVSNLTYPANFFGDDFNLPREQVHVGVTPCGFGYQKYVLPARTEKTSYSLIGSASRYQQWVDFVNHSLHEAYLKAKIDENKQLIESLKSPIFTASNSSEFDLYCGQSFLDNSLRGGYPVFVGEQKNVFYVYSRKHGDLEREYNFFQVDSTYFSQGNSHFRDVNQNRRNDVCFFPFTQDTNLKIFFNLLQLDGFNPLVLKGSRFALSNLNGAQDIVETHLDEKDSPKVWQHLLKSFTPGDLLGFMELHEIVPVQGSAAEFVDKILAVCVREDLAEFGEGYWVDHWTYNNDLLEQFQAVFPDRILDLLFAADEFTYFDTCEFVLPRTQKYIKTENGVRQFGAVAKNAAKEQLIQERASDQFKVCTDNGKGEIYRCSLISKIICLIVNKIASLDPEGVGVEMESNKPGWCDALNGLPGILGSSINESVEIKRTAQILLNILISHGLDRSQTINLPEEVFHFYDQCHRLLAQETDDFRYWDASNQAKEKYREQIRFGLSGTEHAMDLQQLIRFLEAVVAKVDRGLEKARDPKTGIYFTYFINEAVDSSPITDPNGNPLKNKDGYPLMKVLKFNQRPIPLFLEGPIHVLRVEKEYQRAKDLYEAIRKSGLYDETLGMYKVNDNIMNETKEIGRQNVFPRGWLENEAVFLHMEYKYLLELLRCGLYDEFFTTMKTALIPFLDPAVYGRSILENSSFIASTVHPNPNLHGTGFQSRLTGASAEFLNMWLYMTVGRNPFYLDPSAQLCLEFKPILPGWLFTEGPKSAWFYKEMRKLSLDLPAGAFAFHFLGHTLTVYHNPAQKNTFGPHAAQISRIVIRKNNTETPLTGSRISGDLAREIRDGLIDRIDLYFD